VLSRSAAKSTLDMAEFENQMRGIHSSSVSPETLDESPMAYKNMQTIIDCIGDTVEVEKVIKPILNIKAK
jgi:RNA-splicing ligase RtcB